jgi:hypothetical protein
VPEPKSSSELEPVQLVPELVPDGSKETVDIPVRIKEDGEVKMMVKSSGSEPSDEEDLLDEKDLPDLRDDTVGMLTVPAGALKEEKDYERLTAEISEVVVPTTRRVWFRIKTDHREAGQIEEGAKEYLEKDIPSAGRQPDPPLVGKGYRLIPVQLKEHLKLRHRGTKASELHSCKCALPAGLQEVTEEDRPPGSLNQAYMRLSEIFEVHRSTHTGNAFEKGYVRDPVSEGWKELSSFRLRTPETCVWQSRVPWLRPWWVRRGGGQQEALSQQEVFFEINEGDTVDWATFDAGVEQNEWKATLMRMTVRHEDSETEGQSQESSSEKEEEKLAPGPLEDVISELRDNGYRPYDPTRDECSPPRL